MTAVRLLLAGVLGALSLVVLTATPSFACSCAAASTAEYVDGAAAVFTGTVTAKEPPPERPVMSSMDPVTYTFDVERSFKGDVASPTEVLSAMSGASCGLEGVRAGQRYVVFATESRRGDLWASLCGGTAPWSADLEADVVAATGPGVVAPPSAAPAGTAGTPPGQVPGAESPPTGAGPEEAEGGFLAVPVALASGLGLVLLAGLLWLRLLLRR
jgi:hypothetical protein